MRQVLVILSLMAVMWSLPTTQNLFCHVIPWYEESSDHYILKAGFLCVESGENVVLNYDEWRTLLMTQDTVKYANFTHNLFIPPQPRATFSASFPLHHCTNVSPSTHEPLTIGDHVYYVPIFTCNVPFDELNGAKGQYITINVQANNYKAINYVLLSPPQSNTLIPVLEHSMEQHTDNTLCFPILLLLGLLLANLYWQGILPTALFDITIPRLPSAPGLSFGSFGMGTAGWRSAQGYQTMKKEVGKILKSWMTAKQEQLNRILNNLNEDKRARIQQLILMYLNSNISIVKKAILLSYLTNALSSNLEIDEAEILSILRSKDRDLLDKLKAGVLGGRVSPLIYRELFSSLRGSDGAVLRGNIFNFLDLYHNFSQLIKLRGEFHSTSIEKKKGIKRVLNVYNNLTKRIPFWMGPWSGWFGKFKETLYGIDKAKNLVKYAASPLAKRLSEKTPSKVLKDLAQELDGKRIELGKWVRVDKHAERTYFSVRQAIYQDVVKNVVWLALRNLLEKELIRILKEKGMDEDKAMAKAKQLIEAAVKSDANVLNVIVKGPALFRLMEIYGVALPSDFLSFVRDVVGNPTLNWRDKALGVLHWAEREGLNKDVTAQLKSLMLKLEEIDRHNNPFIRLNLLYHYLTSVWRIDQPLDLTTSLIHNTAFITAGRDSVVLRRGPSVLRDNFFTFLWMHELINQWAYLGLANTLEKQHYPYFTSTPPFSGFSLLDALKLAYLKVKNTFLGWGDWYLHEKMKVTGIGEEQRQERSIASLLFNDIMKVSEQKVKELVAKIEQRTEQYFKDLLTPEGKQALMRGVQLSHLLYNPELIKKHVFPEEAPPNQRFWRANMNYYWLVPGVGLERKGFMYHFAALPGEKRYSLLWQAVSQKIRRFTPLQLPLYDIMTRFYENHQFPNYVVGSPLLNRNLPEKLLDEYPVIKSFYLPDAFFTFNEKVRWLSYALKAYANYFNLNPFTEEGYRSLLKNLSQPVSYDEIKHSRVPILSLHELTFLPYIKGLPIGWDWVKNGFLMIKNKGKWEEVEVSKVKLHALKEINENPDLKRFFSARVATLIPESSFKQVVRFLAEKQSWQQLKPYVERVKAFKTTFREQGYVDEQRFNAELAQLRQAIINDNTLSQLEKNDLLSLLTPVERKLLPHELRSLKEQIKHLKASNYTKLFLLFNISQQQKDWYWLWEDIDFVKVTTKQETEGQLKGVHKLFDNVVNWYDRTITRLTEQHAAPLAKEVALAELVRSRSHEIMMEFLAAPPSQQPLNVDYSLKPVLAEKENFWKAWMKHMFGWMVFSNRDPRGSSTNAGRDFMFAAMFHRGPAFPPPPQLTEPFFLLTSPNMSFKERLTAYKKLVELHLTKPSQALAAYVIKSVRNIQTGFSAFPTLYDMSLDADLNQNAMEVFENVQRPFWQSLRSGFHPGEISERWARMRWIKHKEAIITERGGDPVKEGVPEAPVAFMNTIGGAWWRRHTEAANPGTSRVDFTGQSRLDPRLASFLSDYVSSVLGRDTYVQQLNNVFPMRKLRSAEAYLFHEKERDELLGPKFSRRWVSFSPVFAYYWLKGLREQRELKRLMGVPSMWERLWHSVRENWQAITDAVKKKQTPSLPVFRGMQPELQRCPRCGSLMKRGGRCPVCGYKPIF